MLCISFGVPRDNKGTQKKPMVLLVFFLLFTMSWRTWLKLISDQRTIFRMTGIFILNIYFLIFFNNLFNQTVELRINGLINSIISLILKIFVYHVKITINLKSLSYTHAMNLILLQQKILESVWQSNSHCGSVKRHEDEQQSLWRKDIGLLYEEGLRMCYFAHFLFLRSKGFYQWITSLIIGPI